MRSKAPLLPKPVDNADLVFPTSTADMLPPYEDIPKEFKDWNHQIQWTKLARNWFYNGLGGDVKWTPRPGIDTDAALRHIQYCLGSWEPKHEHKMAGCAYLMSIWFKRVPKYTPRKKCDAK